MSQNPQPALGRFGNKIFLELSHPFLAIIAFLLTPIIITDSRTIMVVPVVRGLDDFKLYSIIGIFGILLVVVTYILYRRDFNRVSCILNIIGGLCLFLAIIMAQANEEANLEPRNFFTQMAARVCLVPIGLLMAYNLPFRYKRENENQSEEDIWEQQKDND